MSQFTLNVLAGTEEQRITGVSSFVGEDTSGFFGIQAHHARFMTTLVFGVARFKVGSEAWQYLALPGGVVYFNHNELSLSTRYFLIDTDLERISRAIQQQMTTDEDDLRATHESLNRMEHAMIKRMLTLKRKTEWLS
ncbi:MAG: F0F1 ATP synthase subunit epsilon [Methylococcales bacterium]|nr:F0F1 ATP synthase subunit epsilon [Methylococcaceae bacterium]